MSYHLISALARERDKTLLAEAEASRMARLARTHQRTARDSGEVARRWRPRWVRTHLIGPPSETLA